VDELKNHVLNNQKTTSTALFIDDATRRSLEAAVQAYFDVPAGPAAALVAGFEPVVCRGGDWLFRQGDVADSMYLVARGRLQVWVDTVDGGEPEPRLVGDAGPGEMVGEVGLLTGGRRSAGLRAARNSLLLRIGAADFDHLVQQDPRLMRRVAGGVAERLRDRTAGRAVSRPGFRTVALVSLDGVAVAERIARRLEAELSRTKSTLVLTADRLGALGAPPLGAHVEDVNAALVDWLSAREAEHDHLLQVADPGRPGWSEAVLRQADLVLFIADSAADPVFHDWERAGALSRNAIVSRRALVLLHRGSPERLPATGRWLAGRDFDFHLHLRDGVPGDLARLARTLDGSALGLVLGGGAARGFAHLGAYRALVEAGVAVDWLGGASIGAILAAGLAAVPDPHEAIAKARRAFVEGKPFGDVTLPVVSMLRGRRMQRLIEEFLPGDIEDLPTPFFCVSSNLAAGTPYLHRSGSLPQALRASAAVPGVFPPVVHEKQLVVDGGILDNLPVDRMREQPVGRVIAVDVASRRRTEVDYDSVPSPWAIWAGRRLPFARRYRVPSAMSMLLTSMTIGSMQASRASGERADLLIRPAVGEFGFTDVRPFDRIVEAGYVAAQQALAEAGSSAGAR